MALILLGPISLVGTCALCVVLFHKPVPDLMAEAVFALGVVLAHIAIDRMI